MYKIKLLDNAVKDLKKLDKPIAKRVVAKLNWLAANIEDTQLESLSGNLSDFYKLRVGDYRILFEIHKPIELIIVHIIEHRSAIYK